VKSVALRRVALLSIVIAAACAEDEAQWNVRFAPEFPKTPQRVSILGVFRDGRMNAEAWDELGVRLSAPFGAGACPIAFDKDLVSKKEDFANAVDDYARANGVTDGLLDKLAPAASGDEVLVFTVAGRPRTHDADAGAAGQSAPVSTQPMSSRGGAGRQRAGMAGMGAMRVPDRSAFEVSASLFSPRDHRSVGLVAMEYSGSSASEALTRFAEKLRTALPGATCAGWHWDGPLDEKAIRDLKEDE
jgi:hypothetical protein